MTAIGNVAPSVAVMGVSGNQQGTTRSAIAAGDIVIASEDSASQGIANGISRDTATANDGALAQAFPQAKRDEIASGFAAARMLGTQISTLNAHLAEKEAIAKAEGERRARSATEGYQMEVDPRTGNLVRALDSAGEPIALTAEQRSLYGSNDARLEGSPAYLAAQASEMRTRFGGGSTTRIVLTALNGAASSDVTGGVGTLVQGAAVTVLQIRACFIHSSGPLLPQEEPGRHASHWTV